MLLPVFQDLIKPQWRKVLEMLKEEGGLPVSEIARRLGCHYMTIKPHCDELVNLGYVLRTRVPRAEVGRPEIFHSLSAKADALFPQAGVGFTLEMLEEVRLMFGETAPEKLLFQYFQKRFEQLAAVLDKIEGLEKKALKLAALRAKDGCSSRFENDGSGPPRLLEPHNPLQRVFERYPRAQAMETRMLEQLLDVKLLRKELPGGREGMPRIVFEFR
jgi:predicted ArsR family transcriptional regulator